jgi:hypothetical protein
MDELTSHGHHSSVLPVAAQNILASSPQTHMQRLAEILVIAKSSASNLPEADTVHERPTATCKDEEEFLADFFFSRNP